MGLPSKDSSPASPTRNGSLRGTDAWRRRGGIELFDRGSRESPVVPEQAGAPPNLPVPGTGRRGGGLAANDGPWRPQSGKLAPGCDSGQVTGSPIRPLAAFSRSRPPGVQEYGGFAETAPRAESLEAHVVCWAFGAGPLKATNVMEQRLDADPAPARVGNRVRMPPRDQINRNAAVSECRFRAKPRATATKARQRLAGKWRRVSIRDSLPRRRRNPQGFMLVTLPRDQISAPTSGASQPKIAA